MQNNIHVPSKLSKSFEKASHCLNKKNQRLRLLIYITTGIQEFVYIRLSVVHLLIYDWYSNIAYSCWKFDLYIL